MQQPRPSSPEPFPKGVRKSAVASCIYGAALCAPHYHRASESQVVKDLPKSQWKSLYVIDSMEADVRTYPHPGVLGKEFGFD